MLLSGAGSGDLGTLFLANLAPTPVRMEHLNHRFGLLATTVRATLSVILHVAITITITITIILGGAPRAVRIMCPVPVLQVFALDRKTTGGANYLIQHFSLSQISFHVCVGQNHMSPTHFHPLYMNE